MQGDREGAFLMVMTSLLASLLVTVLSLVSPDDWIGPQKEPPPSFGEIVAEGHWGQTFPDIEFTVPVTGVVQLESWDSDPKCWPDGTLKEGHIYYLNGEPLVPPASTAPCGTEPADNLSSYIRLDVKPGDLVTGDTRHDSGQLTIRFADAQSLLAALGDYVWFDENKNGVQDVDEEGVGGVRVDLYTEAQTFVKTDTTDINGSYLFTGLTPGTYYVEFFLPQGFGVTVHNVSANGQDVADSDPLGPWLDLSISNGESPGAAGKPLTYTLSYSNTDTDLVASDLVISTTLPLGTSFVATNSTGGWNCTPVGALTNCTYPLSSLAAKEHGTITLVLLLDDDEEKVPNILDLSVSLSQGTVGRTDLVMLDPGETDLTVDAGIVRMDTIFSTKKATAPTALPPSEQPSANESIFLPSVQVGN
jgi:hypothetical protein